MSLSIVRLTDPAVDPAIGSGSLAARHICELRGAYKVYRAQ